MELDLNGRLIMLNDPGKLFTIVSSQLGEYGVRAAYCGKKQPAILEALKREKPDIFLYVCGPDDTVNLADISSISSQNKNVKLIVCAFSSFEERLCKYEKAGALKTVIMPMEPERLSLLLRSHLIAGEHSRIPDIADFLYISGISVRPKGIIPICRIIEICCERPFCLRHPSKTRLVYNVANEFGMKSVNLDRLIRYVATKEYDRRTISRITGRTVWWRPGNIPFIAILCDKYTTHLNGCPHKVPKKAEIIQPETITEEIKSRKHKRKWIYVGKPKTDKPDP